MNIKDGQKPSTATLLFKMHLEILNMQKERQMDHSFLQVFSSHLPENCLTKGPLILSLLKKDFVRHVAPILNSKTQMIEIACDQVQAPKDPSAGHGRLILHLAHASYLLFW